MPELSRLQFLAAAVLVVGVVLVGSHALRLSEQGGGAAALVGTGAGGAPGADGGTGSGGATSGRTSTLEVQSPAPQDATGALGPVLVHVVGAVRRPGVYKLAAGARLQDAVERAGGRSIHADLSGVNLAAKATDGQQVVVPRRGGSSAGTGAPGAGGVGAAGEAGGAGAAAGGAVGGAAVPPVDLNTATLEQLETLDGIGPALAQRILDQRTQHGPFRSVEDLSEVSGIGPKRLEALRDRVQV